MEKINLTIIWLLGFAVFIVPLQLKENYEKRIAYWHNRANMFETRLLDCADAGNTQRLYFSDDLYVDFKCVIVKDTTLPKPFRRKSHG